MTIEIPDDVTVGLQGVAQAQKKSVEQVAVEYLRAHFSRASSPEVILQTLRRLNRPSASAVGALDAAIAAAQLPVSDRSAFD
jgi:hypothetical protein